MTTAPNASSVADPIRHHAQERGDKTALHFLGAPLSYADLDARANRVANALQSQGIGAQGRVAILASNVDAWFELYYGAVKAGAVLVPINFRLAPPEVGFIANDSGAEILFVGPEFEGLIEGIQAELPNVKQIVALSGSHASWPAYAEWRDAAPADDPKADGAPEETCIQIYSSGTTGHPKGVELTHQNLLALLDAAMEDWGTWKADDITIVAMPLFHVAGCAWAFCGLHVGATNLLMPMVDPGAILEAIPEHKVTKALFVPAVILFLIQHPNARATDFSSLEELYYGASPIPAAVLSEAIEVFGCGFGQVYGLTETSGAITFLAPEDHDGGPRMKSCGRPMGDAEVRVVDDDGNDCKPGEVGEIAIRTAQVMKGYWNRPEATAEAIRDGWFYSGDAGYLDEDGYLYIHDRVKDMIVSGGENIYPAEIESALASHPKIADIGVIGIPDDKWGESVMAVIVAAPGETPDEEEILAYARERLAGFKVPRHYTFIDELPRNPSGKILKRELRKPYWEGKDRQVN